MIGPAQRAVQRSFGLVAVAVFVIVWLVFALIAPALTAVWTVVYLLLRKWRPDRLLASVIFLLWVPPAVGLALFGYEFGPWWWYTELGWSPSLPWLVTAVSFGPFLAAGWWLVSQWHREHNPYSGRDEYELRQRTEERRRRWVTQLAQRLWFTHPDHRVRRVAAWFAVPLGDVQGPYLGRFQRGDLGGVDTRPWRTGRRSRVAQAVVDRLAGRFVRVPMLSGLVQHLVLFGTTGLGKTETVLTMCEWAIRSGWQVVYLTLKEPAGSRDSVAPRLVALAEAAGRSSRVLEAGHGPFDPMRGSDKEIADRLVKAEEWGDSYWRSVANDVLTLTLAIRRRLGQPVTRIEDLTDTMARFKQQAGLTRDRQLIDRANNVHDEALKGAVTRYRSLAAHLSGWCSDPAAGGWSWEDADLAVAELPTGRQPEAAAAILRMMMRDFGAYLRDRTRRPEAIDSASPRRVLFVVEEAGAVAADPVIGNDFVELVERGRTANVFSLVTAQDPSGLSTERVRSAFLTNGAVASYGQGPQAELVAAMAGTRRVEEGSIAFDGAGVGSGGVTRRQRHGKVDPQLLRELGRGELLVAQRGRFCVVAAGMAESAFRQYASPQAAALAARLDVVEARPAFDRVSARVEPSAPFLGRPAPPGAPSFVPGATGPNGSRR